MIEIVRRHVTARMVVAILGTAAVAVCAFLLLINRPALAEGGDGNGRLLSIYDRGEKKIILSQAATVGEALSEAGISIDKRDAVEPALNEQLVASEYQVNIYRARPVIVVDGALRQRIVTPYQTAARIAADAGITLRSEDTTVLTRSDDIVSDGAGLQLTIDRATDVALTLYGTLSNIRTQGETVAELLAEKNISLNDADRVSPSLETPITPGLTIKVWREGHQTVTVEEAIAFRVERIYDADREIGYKEVRTAGSDGARSVSYEILIEDGEEVNRTEIASLVIREPTTQIEVIGVKGGASTTPSENEAIAWQFFINQGFSAEQTAGIMGNLAQEHGFKTTDVTGGLGVAQWLGARRDALLARPDPYSIYTQLDYIIYEFNNKEYRARDAVRAASTVEASTRAFQNLYERCGLCNEPRRIQFAYSILERYR